MKRGVFLVPSVVSYVGRELQITYLLNYTARSEDKSFDLNINQKIAK